MADKSPNYEEMLRLSENMDFDNRTLQKWLNWFFFIIFHTHKAKKIPINV